MDKSQPGKAEIASRKDDKQSQPATTSPRDIAAFLKAARTLDPASAGRLIFALDATMSRQPTWDRASQVQAAMFDAVGRSGGLQVQLVYFRGFGECRASRWVMNTAALRDLMTGIDCRGGQTQIRKVLAHARREAGSARVSAVVFIGDAMEEDADELCRLAGELGMLGVQAFVFQEGGDPLAERTFREIARLTGGAWLRLGPDSSNRLAELLGAVAVYAKGGMAALESRSGPGARALLENMAKSTGRGAASR